jgi:hypothetical protein
MITVAIRSNHDTIRHKTAERVYNERGRERQRERDREEREEHESHTKREGPPRVLQVPRAAAPSPGPPSHR